MSTQSNAAQKLTSVVLAALREEELSDSTTDSNSSLCETRTVVIDAGKCMNLKITTYNIVFQKVEKNNFFSRRKAQLLL